MYRLLDFEVSAQHEGFGHGALTVVVAVFITCLLIANIISVKLVAIGRLAVPAGIVIFPISYICGDVLTEVYGFRSARQVIWLGFGCNLLAVIAIWLGQQLPAPAFWDGQAAYEHILGFTPRLLLASFLYCSWPPILDLPLDSSHWHVVCLNATLCQPHMAGKRTNTRISRRGCASTD